MTPTLALLSLLAAAPEPVMVDRVAALVNGEVVMLSELTERAGSEWFRVQALLPGKEREQELAEMLRKAFDMVLAEKLLQAAAVKDGVDASPQAVDAAVEEIKQRNKLAEGQLEEELRKQGLDLPTFKVQVKRDLDAYYALESRVRGRVKLADLDLLNYYQAHQADFAGEAEVHVRHIFLPLPDAASAEAEQKIRAEGNRIRARILAGADFADEARKVSKGPSAAEGGDLGWIKRGTIQPAIEDVAFKLEPGQVSDWLRAGPGLHLLKVDERRSGDVKTFEQVKEEVRNKLYQQQVEGFRSQLIAELRSEAVIEPRLPALGTTTELSAK